jgi:DsbC/DsbD-like thiol-disulfide interchange protein
LPPLDLGEIGDAKPQVKLFAPEPTRAEPVKAAMQSSAAAVTPGGQFDVLVQARIFPDFHIYGMDPKVSPFLPTALKLTRPDGLEAAGDWTGPSPQQNQAGVDIYTGAAVFRRTLQARAGAAPKKCSIRVELEYQVCNNEMCYPPKKVELDATVEIAAARQP